MYKNKIGNTRVLEISSLRFSGVETLLQREKTQPSLQNLWRSTAWLVSVGESLNVDVDSAPSMLRIIKKITTDFIFFLISIFLWFKIMYRWALGSIENKIEKPSIYI